MKITTSKIKELIPHWLNSNNTGYDELFNDWFGTIGPSIKRIEEYSKELKCGKEVPEIISALKLYISDGKNWKRYEKGKFSLDEYNEEDNGQQKICGWESSNFIPNNDNYIVRRFQSKFSDFDERILRVLSNIEDTEIMSWGLFDS